MFNRREWFQFSAAAVATARRRVDPSLVRRRMLGEVEVVFKTPAGSAPNGLQATREGLWIIDQAPGNRAYLTSFQGKVLRSFETETDKSSGITFDGEALWVASTYSREIVRCSATTGKALDRHFTPGAGVIYKMAGDPPGRSSPLARARPSAPAPPAATSPTIPLGTGAHGLEWKSGKLWVAVPPSREVYRIDPKTWTVEMKFPVAGNRPHGIGWEDNYLWVTDSNLNAFYKHDPANGDIVERIQLSEKDPLPHGMTIWDGWLWYCDDVGVVCRLKLGV